MHLPMDYLLGIATRKELLSFVDTHSVKAKDKLNSTYDNSSLLKLERKKNIVHFMKELEQNT